MTAVGIPNIDPRDIIDIIDGYVGKVKGFGTQILTPHFLIFEQNVDFWAKSYVFSIFVRENRYTRYFQNPLASVW